MKKSVLAAVKASLAAFVEKGIQKIKVSRKNKKLRPNSETAFIIWNLPAVMTCPNRTKHCEGACYARKAERAYPTVLPRRLKNLEISRQADFVERMTYTILSIAAGSRKKNIIVRIHESGDFYNKAYVNAWLQIMQNCAIDKRIKFIAYTKSFRFFDGVKLPSNFYLRASVWDDTPVEDLVTITRNGWTIYTAVEKFQKGDTFTRCRCEDCATCSICWSKRKDIRCEIH